MENIWKTIVKMTAAVGGVIGGALGGWDSLLSVLVGMMAADYISGVIVAAMGKSKKTEYGGLSSKVGWIGLAKKGLMLLVVLIGTLLDGALGVDAMCRDAVCWFYVANECISLVENLNLIGVPFPERIREILGEKKETEAVMLRNTQGEEAPGASDSDIYIGS